MAPPPNHRVQAIAKDVMAALASTLCAQSTERSIADDARRLFRERGIADTWYYDCIAYVLLGSRSCLSISGRDYLPGDELAGEHNLVTIDLSPREGELWGDFARSFCVEGGRVVEAPASDELREGLRVEAELHAAMARFATRRTSFHELFSFANDAIARAGYENLDFMGNVGHSIATRREDRVYVEAGNRRALGEVPCFTFEPHIRKRQCRFGFKREDIYYFDGDRCTPL